jgi:hypothetical protein
MASGQMTALKRFLLWDYPRASWQYDLMVALILAFIFLIPRGVFRDQPRASNIVRLPSENGASVFFVEPELLNSVPEPERGPRLENELKSRFGKRETVVHLEPVLGSEKEIKGYMAYARP